MIDFQSDECEYKKKDLRSRDIRKITKFNWVMKVYGTVLKTAKTKQRHYVFYQVLKKGPLTLLNF